MNDRTATGCLPSCFPKLFSGFHFGRERIEEQLARDKLVYSFTHQVLIMGYEQSGKSTIFTKLRQIHHGGEFSGKVKAQGDLIRKYVVDVIVHILTEMKKLSPPIRLSSLKNEAAASIILEVAKKPNFRYFDEFSTWTNIPNFVNLRNLIRILWQDPALVQATTDLQCYEAQHFFDRLDEISKESYIPSSKDYLLCPNSSQMNINDFFVKGVVNNFRFIDISNQFRREVFRRWIHYQEPNYIVFVMDCSSYDIIEDYESPLYNKLHSSLHLLKNAIYSKWFLGSYVYVVLNKYDVFKKKILSGSKLEDYFPGYKNFTCSIDEESDEHVEVVRAICFIRNEIEKISPLKLEYCCLPYQICAHNDSDIRLLLSEFVNLPLGHLNIPIRDSINHIAGI